jgi:hypothetical protein
MQDSERDDRAEFGVLFVAGIGKQRPGNTVVSYAGALYGWLFRFNHAERRAGSRPRCMTPSWPRTVRASRRTPS